MFRPTVVIALLILLTPFMSKGQFIQDKCFFSVATEEDFDSSEQISNIGAQTSDIVKYEDGDWSGPPSLNIAPPIQCDASKAVYLEVLSNDTVGEGVGFRLSSDLNNGSTLSLEITYVSHGAGSNGSFSPQVFTHSGPNLMDNGIIQGSYIGSLPPVGNAWETISVSFNIQNQSAGDNWVFIYALESSGMIFNMCQVDQGTVEYGPNEEFHACEGESVLIGENIGEDLNYSWSNGGSGVFTEVSSQGAYTVTASNNCSSDSKIYFVVLHGDPELYPDITDVLFCVGDSVEITSIGLEPENLWPDGSTDSTFTIGSEGIYEIFVEDECGILELDLYVDFDTIPFIELGPDRSICQGQSLTLDGGAPGAIDYQWSNGVTDSTIVITEEDTYSLTVSNECGSYTDHIFVEVSQFNGDLLPDTQTICLAKPYSFDLSEIEGTYLWSDGTTEPIMEIQYTGTYWVEVLDDDYCFLLQDTVKVIEGPCDCPIFIPNAFTPDGDGLNDMFHAEYECEPYDFTLEVYDRWGNVIYRSHYPGEKWDGQLRTGMIASGIYNWRVWYRESFHGIPIEDFGTVTILGGKLE